MEEKFWESYSSTFTEKIIDAAYARQVLLSGQVLLRLTPSQQVNLFVLKALYRAWQKETLRLESPYFDYQHPSVRQALQDFMNILSKHISVRKNTLAPILQEAVLDTLHLMFSPERFFRQELITRTQTLSTAYLKNTARYLRIQQAMFKVFADTFQTLHKHTLSAKETEQFFEQCVVRMPSAEPIDTYIAELASVLPLKDERAALETPQQSVHTDTEDKSSVVSALNMPESKVKTFVQFLFKGDRASFLEAMENIKKCQSFDKSIELLLTRYGKQYAWNTESVHAKELFKEVFLHLKEN